MGTLLAGYRPDYLQTRENPWVTGEPMSHYEGKVTVIWRGGAQGQFTVRLEGDESSWGGLLDEPPYIGPDVPDQGEEVTLRFEDGSEGTAKVLGATYSTDTDESGEIARTPIQARIEGRGPVPFGQS